MVGTNESGRPYAVGILFVSLTIFLAQFLSFAPYWMVRGNETHFANSKVEVGPWFSFEDGRTVGIEKYDGNDGEYMVAVASSVLFIMLCSLFSVISAGVAWQRYDTRYRRDERPMGCRCPVPGLTTMMMILTILQLVAVILVAVCMAQAVQSAREEGLEYGILYWIYLALTVTAIVVQFILVARMQCVRENGKVADGRVNLRGEIPLRQLNTEETPSETGIEPEQVTTTSFNSKILNFL